MANLTSAFYENLYASEGVQHMDRVLDTVPRKVTPEMNAQKEVKDALFQMFPIKAPGPDGFPTHFFQHHWDVCGDEVTKVVLRIVEGTESAVY